jgi:uncharacterized protein YtpQ (UPF0354 family)
MGSAGRQTTRFARLFASIACLAIGVLARAADDPSQRAFTDEYVVALRAALPGVKVESVKPLEVKVTLPDGKSSTAFLTNAYNDLQRDPSSRKAIIERQVASMVEVSKPDEGLDQRNIVPVIKDRAWMSETAKARQAASGGATFQHVYDDFNEDLVVVYAEDRPTNTHYFEEAALKKAGVERKDLRELAKENLRRILPDLEREEIGGVSLLSAGGDYDASLLLFDEIWTGDLLKVKGEIVVAVPARNVLLFAPANDPARVEELEALVRRVFAENSYTLTDQLFVFSKGKFRRYSR